MGMLGPHVWVQDMLVFVGHVRNNDEVKATCSCGHKKHILLEHAESAMQEGKVWSMVSSHGTPGCGQCEGSSVVIVSRSYQHTAT